MKRVANVMRQTMYVIIFIASVTATRSQSPQQQSAITSPRPLLEATVLLQRKYGKPITYEDPVWVWRGEIQSAGRDSRAKWALLPKARNLILPLAVFDSSPTLALNKILDVSNLQSDGLRFQVSESSFGLHVIPTQVRNENGQIVPASNLLDMQVSVPEDLRTPSEHFQYLCTALSAASSMNVTLNASGIRPWLDQLFAAEHDSFIWGGNGLIAREALLDLISHSATSLSWHLLCQPSEQPQDRFCVLNIRPIEIDVIGRDGSPRRETLTYDRCGKCPPLLVPPAK